MISMMPVKHSTAMLMVRNDNMPCKVNFLWDETEAVWIATSEDVPGLVLECGSVDALIERVKSAIPELLSLNGTQASDYRLFYSMQREDRVSMYG